MNTNGLLIEAVPGEYIELAERWHSGQSSMFYALSSSGNITPGDQVRWNDDEDRHMTPQEQHVSLWQELECEISSLLRDFEKQNYDDDADAMEDKDGLEQFHLFSQFRIKQLQAHYGLETE